MRRAEFLPSGPAAPAALAALLGLTLLAPVATAAGPVYVTASGAARQAVRELVRRELPRGTKLVVFEVGCAQPPRTGDRRRCEGFFGVRRGGRRAPRVFYEVRRGSRVLRTGPGTIEARLRLRRELPRTRAARGFPARLQVTSVLRGVAPPAERTVHADLRLVRGERVTLSRTAWVGFPVPFFARQAYGEGPVTLTGTVEERVEVPPGGVCNVEQGLVAGLRRDAPVERDGRLFVGEDEFDSGMPIASRAVAPDGSVLWLSPVEGRGASGVRSGAAPPGLGPRELDTLVLEARVDSDLERYGRPTADGYPPLEPTRAQVAACRGHAEAAARRFLPRALEAAVPSPRPRPPVVDPDEEAPIPIEPRE